MRNKTTLLLGAVVLAQLLFLMGFVFYKEAALRTGRTVVLQALPIDPRDPFRGDYVVLRYIISNLGGDARGDSSVLFYDLFAVGDTVYLRLDGAGTEQEPARAQSAAHTPQPGWDITIRGRVIEANYPDREPRPPGALFVAPFIRVEYGIESYFVPEGVGLDLQRSRDIKAVVAIDFEGRAVLKSLIVDGKPFQTR